MSISTDGTFRMFGILRISPSISSVSYSTGLLYAALFLLCLIDWLSERIQIAD